MKAPFIAIEALDGIGKTTLTRRLAASLGGLALDTPGEALRPVRAGVLDGLGPHQTARCLFYAATVLSVGDEARRITDAGTPVVVDRYWLSTRAYARARGVMARLDDIEALVTRPDATVLLTIDEAERQRRLRSRGTTEADRETLDPRFRQVVLDDMRLPGALRPTHEIDVTGLDPDAVVVAVRAALFIRRPPATPTPHGWLYNPPTLNSESASSRGVSGTA